MQVFIRGGHAGKLFITKCRVCKNKFSWNKIVVMKYDWGEEWNHCITCYEDIHGKLPESGWLK